MALLDAAQRKLAWAKFVAENSQTWGGVLKQDLSDAVDAVDDWVNDNQTSYNNALPAAAKAELTAAQKAHLLAAVVTVRFKEDV